jgi:FtsP/CotA-like multicopper oxidase with cupredoxin domain
MRLTASAAPLLALAVMAPTWHPPVDVDSARIEFNDNHITGGRLKRGTFTLDLEIRRGAWHMLGDDKAGGEVLAFGQTGSAPSIPGPLIRVPLGTEIRVRVVNRSSTTLVVHGLSSRRGVAMDSLLLAPNASGEARFTADAEGTFFYWAGAPGVGIDARYFEDSQLYGAFVVDPPGVRSSPTDRVLVLGIWFDGRLANGERDEYREFLVINGRPWPHTERLSYQLGDSVRWRVINASSGVHPMHLHGFYYRVEARGDITRDTTYWPAEQRMVVTERLPPGSTMTMAFLPDRPGSWIFHCHLNWHVVSNPRMGEEKLSPEEREREVVVGHADHDPQNHIVNGMGGLLLAFNVEPPSDWTPPGGVRRKIRLFVQSGTANGDTVQRSAFVVQDGDIEPAPDSVRMPGSPLILRRGEPTSIWVINRSGEPTQVHWHGLELESAYDGVVGVGGLPNYRPPAIMPRDSFEVRITPPRAGSFMYHTHFNEIKQMSRGLWGPFIVLEPEEKWNPEKDRVFMAGERSDFGIQLNGGGDTLATIQVQAGERYRFRLMNVTMGGPNLEFWLVRDGSPLLWLPLARDGHDLPDGQRRQRRAHQLVGIGETMDVAVSFPGPGMYALELRAGNGKVISRQPIDAKPRPAPVSN